MAHRSDTGLDASRLRIMNIPGATRVKLHTRQDMAIELSGPEQLIKDISWETRNGTLHVTGPEGTGGGVMINSFSPGGGQMSIRGGHGNVVIGGRNSMIVTSAGAQTVISTGGRGGTVIVDGKVVSGGGQAEAGEAELTVYVPAGSPVQITDDCAGNYDLGDVRSTLDLKLEGASAVRAGVMRATRAEITGSARVTVASVLDSLHADITGSGSVDAEAGEVADLNLDVTGSGRATFAGTARDADLDVTGSGRIRVDTVTRTLRRNVTGSGRIDVQVQPRRTADDFWS